MNHPREAHTFHFVARDYDAATGIVSLRYRLEPGPELEEQFVLPSGEALDAIGLTPCASPDTQAVDALLDALHWLAGVSYWKTACPPRMVFHDRIPDAWQAALIHRVYFHGLAEFAHRNGLDLASRLNIPHQEPTSLLAPLNLMPEAYSPRALVPIGGGKDSLVVVERLRAAGVPMHLAVVGQAPLMDEVAAAAELPLLRIRRRLAPALNDLNQAGAWNGHVPITAINSAVLSLAVVVWGFRWLVFANERSADSPTQGEGDENGVNHQYSKSLAFERDWRDYLSRYVGAPEYLSLLRPWRELAICREFAALPRYHTVFSSCNRNFHLSGSRLSGKGAAARWCGHCPKCHFVFLALAPFLSPERLHIIFGQNLLDLPDHTQAFAELLGLQGERPFECIGEIAECRAALAALAQSPAWCNAVSVHALASRLPADTPTLAALLEPSGEHFVPAPWMTPLLDVTVADVTA